MSSMLVVAEVLIVKVLLDSPAPFATASSPSG
jgi:hypothetical protein